jgi:RES domain-containing protein
LTQVYRVLRKAFARSPLDGQGAYLYGGRWSSAGTRLAYTSEHQSLGMLEYFVHLDAVDAAADLVLVMADVPDDVPQERVVLGQLPSTWRDFPAPPELAGIGDDFVRRGENCVLIVPSALAPHENNWLLNPQHKAFGKVGIFDPEPLVYDSRMFAPRRGRRR